MAINGFCHVEINVRDLEKAREFYSKLFCWEFEELEKDYWGFKTGSYPGGAITNRYPDFKPGGGILFYIEADCIDELLPQVAGVGGAVLAPKTKIPGIGFSALITDPWDNPLGLFEPLIEGSTD